MTDRSAIPAALFYLAGAPAYLSFGFTEMMGSDLWWHLAAGREIVQNGSVWLLDSWSFTANGSVWHNHEWLADLIFYGWASLGGVESLVYWKWLLLVSTFLLLQRVLLRIGASFPSALLCSVAAMAIAAPYLDLRPQLYTLLGISVLLNLALLRVPKLWEVSLLFVVWVNLHGGFIFGLMLLAILVCPWNAFSPGVKPARALKRGSITLAVAVSACLVNPDFFRVFVLPLTYALNSDSPYRSIAEWRSPLETGGIVSGPYLYSLVIGASAAFCWSLPTLRRKVSVVPEAVVFALLTAAMSLTSRRFTILWAVAFAVLLHPFLAALLRERFPRMAVVALLATVLVWAGGYVQQYSLRPAVAYHYLTAEYTYPHGLAEFVALNRLEGNTFALYNWGGFLHWRTDGALKVFIDGRANTVFDDQTYLDYVAVAGAQPGWLERVENSGASLFLWPRARGGERLIQGLQNTGRWILLYQDARGALLAHQDHPLPLTLRRPKDTLAADLAETFANSRRGEYAVAEAAARRAREREPWNQAACTGHKRTLQLIGKSEEGEAVMEECQGYFRSRFLR
ncbi:MAG: hypothetical protein AAGG55_01285 [Pseudomonadota bacterium]